MKKIEYKFIKLPSFHWVTGIFKSIDNINTGRIEKLEESFNSLGKDGWELMRIYWWEGMALFTREIQNKEDN